MRKNQQKINRIKYLEKKYSETNVARDELLSPETVSRINKTYNDNQRKRRVDGILNEVRNKDSIKEEVHQIVAEVSLKKLCANCKEEVIISVIILYVLKCRNSRFHIERSGLWHKYDLSWQKYSLIITRLLQETRKSLVIKK